MPTRPDLEGLLIRLDPRSTTSYLVDQGRARAVPNDPVFIEWMFVPGAKLWTTPIDIDLGQPLDRTDVLTRAQGSGNIFWEGPLGVRHIADPGTFHRFNFNWDRIQISPLEPKPTAPDVKWVPRYNGNRIKVPSADPIYLIDGDMKRHILEPATYRRLFGDTAPQAIDSVSHIPTGPDIGAEAILIKGDRDPPVYFYELVAGKFPKKRHIVNSQTMVYYGFAFGRVEIWPQARVDAIESGPRIVWPDGTPA